MQLKTYKSMWGMTGPLDEHLRRIQQAGYDGIESALPGSIEWIDPGDEPHLGSALADHDLEFLPMIITVGPDGEITSGTALDHLRSFKSQVERALVHDPVQVTVHGGLDTMDDAEAMAFFEGGLEIEREIGLPVAYETHRHRILYTSWRTAEMLRRLPDLKLVADYSHWVLVAERLLDDRADDLEEANQRVIHIQGRVGHEEHPQVADPRAPESTPYVERFEEWWASIIRHRVASGEDTLTFTPEYGVNNYLPTLPYTQQPVADLWDVCLWANERFKSFFAQTMAAMEAPTST